MESPFTKELIKLSKYVTISAVINLILIIATGILALSIPHISIFITIPASISTGISLGLSIKLSQTLDKESDWRWESIKKSAEEIFSILDN